MKLKILASFLCAISFVSYSSAMRHVITEETDIQAKINDMEIEHRTYFPYVMPGVVVIKDQEVERIAVGSFSAIHPKVLLSCAHFIEDIESNNIRNNVKNKGILVDLHIHGKKFKAEWVVNNQYQTSLETKKVNLKFSNDIKNNHKILESSIGLTSNPEHDISLFFLKDGELDISLYPKLSAQPHAMELTIAKLVSYGYMAQHNKPVAFAIENAMSAPEKYIALYNMCFVNKMKQKNFIEALKYMKDQIGNIQLQFNDKKNAFVSICKFPKGNQETLFKYPSEETQFLNPVQVTEGASGGAVIFSKAEEEFVLGGVISSHTHVSLQNMEKNLFQVIFGEGYEVPNKTYFTSLFANKDWIDGMLKQRDIHIEWDNG